MGGVWVGQLGLFDLDERYAALSKRGDPLERLAAVVDFEMFGPIWRRRSIGRIGRGLRWTR